MNGFRLAASLLLLTIAVWVFYPVEISPLTPRVLDVGTAFDGNLQLPATEVHSEFVTAEMHLYHVNAIGAELRLAGDIASWVAFGSAGCISLMIGLLGKRPYLDRLQAEKTAGLRLGILRSIGLLASLTAVLTAFSNLASSKAQEHFDHADQLQKLIVDHRSQILEAKTKDQAIAVLEDLKLKANRE